MRERFQQLVNSSKQVWETCRWVGLVEPGLPAGLGLLVFCSQILNITMLEIYHNMILKGKWHIRIHVPFKKSSILLRGKFIPHNVYPGTYISSFYLKFLLLLLKFLLWRLPCFKNSSDVVCKFDVHFYFVNCSAILYATL